MKLAAILIVALSHQGYWIAGQPATITLRPAVEGGLPDALLIWELAFDGVRLDQGQVLVANGGKETEIHLIAPTARLRIPLQWHYRLVARNGGKELESRDLPISLFPADLTAGLASQIALRHVVVWDKPDSLPRLMALAKIPYARISSAEQLQFAPADIILVGQDVMTDSNFEQYPLLNMAKNGASVMIFRQTRPTQLLGYTLGSRNTRPALEWRLDHPLLAGLTRDDVESWLADTSTLAAIELPPDEPVLDVAGFPREVPGSEPAPIDAIMLTRTIGKGRIVFCQLPLGDWSADPRSQILLGNSIDYLLTRPQPTPRPSERHTLTPTRKKANLRFQILPGDY